MPRNRPSPSRLAGLGALGAALGIAVVFALFVVLTYPGTGGMDWTLTWITWISVGGIAAALIAVHIAFAKKLLAIGAEHEEGQRGRES